MDMGLYPPTDLSVSIMKIQRQWCGIPLFLVVWVRHFYCLQLYIIFMFSSLSKKCSRRHFEIVFIVFLEYYVHIVPFGDSFHILSNPILLENKKKISHHENTLM